MICFDPEELKQLFEAPSRQRIREESEKSGYSGFDLLKDQKKMEEISNRVKLINSKEDFEIFCALYVFPVFYKEESKVCFLLNGKANPRAINTLEDLKLNLKEKDLTDFIFWHKDGFRPYQLKTYRGKTEINEFFEYVREKLLHYANDIGEINILFLMQSEGDFTGDFFQDLHERIKALRLKGTGEILLSYNEANQFNVMNIVYPNLGTTRIPM